ncbi:MAG: 16S rRNA (guanine(527)-N(7))-methyltransferase RsmG [Anaerolineae bacterium]|nr:16S rRNA (guanine(527)-N(7))-methyltransferase RsmG [Anaerolineae bacterium]NIN94570.1 16S rRNA (guanine(527)-N(7))-methyltransferase RsmG [Anaerolineae bacterium]NIQ77631.1 16S rRNA (guanine(527)-N(7))-methyltransferase RsmG [Anaerolineae bacterium]
MQLLKAGVKGWGLALTPDQLEAFELYYQELMLWNERASLTAITDYREVQVKHFLDSLSCLQVLTGLAPATRCIDIGAGAGFPGLPLRIACPQMHLTLLEATRKKVLFLEHMVKELGLRDVQVIQGRAEELGRQAGHREVYDVALARAVAELSVLLEYALPLLKVEGIFVAQKGGDIEDEVEGAGPAMNLLGGRLKEVREVRLLGLDDARHLVVVEKVGTTPDKYPRRPGIPGKRPLKGR